MLFTAWDQQVPMTQNHFAAAHTNLDDIVTPLAWQGCLMLSHTLTLPAPSHHCSGDHWASCQLPCPRFSSHPSAGPFAYQCCSSALTSAQVATCSLIPGTPCQPSSNVRMYNIYMMAHATAQHSTAQHSTAQHSTAQQSPCSDMTAGMRASTNNTVSQLRWGAHLHLGSACHRAQLFWQLLDVWALPSHLPHNMAQQGDLVLVLHASCRCHCLQLKTCRWLAAGLQVYAWLQHAS